MLLAVASSSERDWVDTHLERSGMRRHFGVIRCADDVSRVKPDPDLYLVAIEVLGVASGEAVAFEDSPNGVRAARAAGLRVVAVPGPMTRDQDFSDAQLCLPSLAGYGLAGDPGGAERGLNPSSLSVP